MLLYFVVGVVSVAVGFVAGFVSFAFLAEAKPLDEPLTEFANQRFREGFTQGYAQGLKETKPLESQDEKAILELGRKLEEENKK